MGSFTSDGFTTLQSRVTILEGDVSDEIVVVKSLADLPTPVMVGGVNTIVLEEKEYLFDVALSSANPLGFPGAGKTATIRAVNRSVWTYTGTDACFKDPDAEGNIEIHGLTEFQAPTGDMWDVTASTGGWSFQAGGPACKFTNCNSLGQVNGGASGNAGFNLFFGTLSDFDQGLTATDLFFFEINTMFLFGNNAASSTYFTVTGANSSGSVNLYTNTFNNGTNETMMDFTSNIETGVDSINIRANVQEGGINGTVLKAGSLGLDTPKVFSEGNTLLADSQPAALLFMDGNAVATDITSSSPKLVAGTWTTSSDSLFTTTAAGRATFDGLRPYTAVVDVIATLDPGTPANTFALHIALNGTPIAGTDIPRILEASDPGILSTQWVLSLTTGDFLEIFVENRTSTTEDVTATDIIFRVR